MKTNQHLSSYPTICLLFLLLTCTFSFSTIWAQSPEKMSYQAVIRNAGGQLVSNQSIGIRIQILKSSEFGAAVYVETQTRPTNANGLLTLEIGEGNVVMGSFSGINWAAGPYFLKTEIDPAGGTSYNIAGTIQLLSVPYALYAKSVATEADPVFSISPASGITGTHITNWNSAFGWGNHSGLYRPVSWVPAWTDLTGKPTTFTPAGHTHSTSDINAGTLGVARGGTGISSYTTGNYIMASGATTLSQRTPSQVRADISAGTVSSIATGNGISGGTITTTGTLGLTGQSLALHNLSTNGIIARTASGTVTARTITAGAGITVTNGNGVSNNPVIAANIGMDWVNISRTGVDVRTNAINAGSVAVTAPVAGYVVVRFDGQAYASTGDLLVLAASSSSQTWSPDDGNVGILGDGNPHPFSHTRVYSVAAGTHTFYGVAHNYVNYGGNGKASIYATLTAVFYPNRY